MPSNVTPNLIEHKTIRFGVKCGNFILVYERITEKPKPVKQVKDTKLKQLTPGGIDIYV